MNKTNRSILKQLGLAVTIAFAATAPQAAADSQPLMVVVPFGPGGSSDLVARHITQHMAAELKRNVVIDNRPGATGAIGASSVARSAPDGNTMLIASIGVFAINPAIQPKLSYNPQTDFTLLTEAVRTPNVLVTRAGFPVSNVKELIAMLKQSPGAVSFASGGLGSSEHLNTELFWQETKTEGLHVPYKGSGQAVSDLLAGHADVGFLNLSAVSPHIKSGKLQALAITSKAPSSLLPDVPTMAQAGIGGLEVYSWQGVAVPRKVDPQIAGTLQQAVFRSLRDPEIEKKLIAQGFEVVASSQKDFEAFVVQENDRWKKVVTTANIKID
ncbi:LacI family transcriptional regulator [Pollutimonas subterranea]|uniref:LacI family transcriptional regulator n=1 Tax=Pollutimonas subterranea TaxID=2045210 RepID=A0A2N4U4E2_9BURK|nr:tripartite tricarboxylate transporter substrate binding protein [Pollutimonas subterranea]PLC49873.1 LacI family transcriptional regulator [Pollutimonas subterranea]